MFLKTSVLLPVCIMFYCTSCVTTRFFHKENSTAISKLVFLSEKDVPFNQLYKTTIIGGLSGIDYDVSSNKYYLISDDRSALSAARFYTANIRIANNIIDTIIFMSVDSLKTADGNTYPGSKQDAQRTPDPEGIRYNPRRKTLVWTSEGERLVTDNKSVLTDPAIIEIDTMGRLLDTFAMPVQLRMSGTESGPRQNGVLEGLTFADDFKTLYVNVEEPLYQDGPRATVSPTNSWIRIVKYEIAKKRQVAQYAYQLDPVAYPSSPANAFQVNGVPDILSVAPGKLLVIERSFSTGRLACTIKVFLAELSGAEDISNNNSLTAKPPVRPIRKTLLLNMDSLGMYTDNIEGLTFGPNLPNGHKTLVFVADNNFSSIEKTQFLLFEIIP